MRLSQGLLRDALELVEENLPKSSQAKDNRLN
jgi:hypothetical protein